MAPPKRNFNDFLINFGLDIASRPSAGPGLGGLSTTAAQSAKSPYEQFAKTRDAEQNLLRQVGMEAEIMDCLLYTSPSPRDGLLSRMPSSA